MKFLWVRKSSVANKYSINITEHQRIKILFPLLTEALTLCQFIGHHHIKVCCFVTKDNFGQGEPSCDLEGKRLQNET